MKRSVMSFLLLLPLVFVAAALHAAPVGTAFTYQGRLEKSGVPVVGASDFKFTLYDSLTAGHVLGTTLTQTGIAVTNGTFNTVLDFGAGLFTGQARWIEIAVKGPGDASFTTLTPRQPLTPSPYAVYAAASPGSGTGPWQVGSDGADLTYANGGVGFTGHSSPFPSGNGVFIEGNNPPGGLIFAYDYSALTAKDLLLQTPGGRVGIGTTAPGARLDVAGQGRFTNYGLATDPLGYPAALYAFGYTGVVGLGGGSSMGIYSASQDSRGVWGISSNNLGVVGDNTAKGNSGWLGGVTEGVYGQATTTASYGGRFFNSAVGGIALRVDGLAQVKTLQITGGADLAERFEAPEGVTPGTVMAIDPASPGRLIVADGAYLHTVAGVVSGANGLDAGVQLGKGEPHPGAVALALTGRVWVRCDASEAPIHPGDLLTTATRAGHAMKALDHDRAQGAIVGKAMSSLETGTGLVLVLVTLQ